MTTAFDQPTVWSQPSAAVPAPAAEPPSRQPKPTDEPVLPESDDPWESVKLLAEKAAATAGIEAEMTQAFDKRRTLAKRLADAYRRKDDKLASEAAQAWIRSEITLAAVFERYEGHVQERNELLQAYVNETASG